MSGRPRSARPRNSMNGKGRLLNASVTGELYAMIEAEADRTGRSISRVAEAWLERGRLASAVDRKIIEADERREESKRVADAVVPLENLGMQDDDDIPLDKLPTRLRHALLNDKITKVGQFRKLGFYERRRIPGIGTKSARHLGELLDSKPPTTSAT